MAADLIFDVVGRVFEPVDFNALSRDRCIVPGDHCLNQRNNLPSAYDCGGHVFLHWSYR